MKEVISKDRTNIAFDQLGEGPPVILVSGGSVDRTSNAALAALLICLTAPAAQARPHVLVVGDSLEELTSPYLSRYLPGVEQFVELGAGYDTRTVQLQHNRRIRCFEVDLPKTQQMKRALLSQCGVDTSGVRFVSANFLTDDWLENLAKTDFDPRKPTFFLWEGVTYYLSREAMEKTFRTIATMAPGSVVVFDYATEANIKAYRKPLGILQKALLKAVREPQTFWISSEPPVKKTVAALMQGYGLSLREQLDFSHETKRKHSRGGLAAAVAHRNERPEGASALAQDNRPPGD